MTVSCTCQDVQGNVWYWNAAQCVAVQVLMFQNAPRLKKGIPDEEHKQATTEWRQMASFLTVHLGLFGVESVLKGLITKYGLLPESSDKLRTHRLDKLFHRLPTHLKAAWRNRYTQLQQDRQLDVPILSLTQIIERYANSYQDARYRPDKVGRKDINLFTFCDVIESGVAIFSSSTCYCLHDEP